MKKCPFCAEEIQDAAIKCRFCGSLLGATSGAQVASGPPDAGPSEGAAPAAPPPAPLPFAREVGKDGAAERKLLYEGVPSWKAYFKYYVLAVLAGGAAVAVLLLFVAKVETPVLTRGLFVAIPLVVVAVVFFVVNLYRRSVKIRVTSTVIETEHGILTRRIDVLQLWRCRDVRYRQTLSDRILGIAHIDVFAQDSTTDHLEMVGLPASRQLFEQLRDSIEIQRSAKNVYGVVS